MKRFLALAALVLGMVSCQTEPEGLDVNVGGEQDVNITVSLPEGTRADSGLGAFDNVDFTKYDVRFQCEVHYSNEKKVLPVQYGRGDDAVTTATFPVRLIANRDYTFVVWADLVEEGQTADLHYNTANGLKQIVIKDWKAMDETRDAYTCSETRKFTRANGIGETLTLTRPFAKLRVITTDMNELMGVKPTWAKVEYATPYYTSFNAYDQKPYDLSSIGKTHSELFDIVSYDESGASKTLFTDYFFAINPENGQAPETVAFTMEVFDENGATIDEPKSFNTAIPVKRNYLTTIKGNILTYADDFTVTIDDGFANANNPEDIPYYYAAVTNGADLLKAISEGREIIALNNIVVTEADKNFEEGTTRSTTAINPVLNLNGFTITIENNGTGALVDLGENGALTVEGNGKIISTTGALVKGDVVVTGEAEVEAEVAVDDNGNSTVKTGVEALAYVLANGGEFTFTKDLAISEVLLASTTNPIVINGADFTLTSAATRAIRATVANANIVVNDLNIDVTTERVYPNDVRGISVDDVTGVELTLNNCSVIFSHTSGNDWAYAVNVTGGSNHKVTVNGGTYNGANVINVRGKKQTVIVKNATLTSLYPNNDVYYGACIYVVQNENSSVYAEGNTFNGDNALAFNIGYTPIEEKNNTNNAKRVSAKVNGAYYYNIAEAIAAAEDGATIKVLQSHDCNVCATVPAGKTLTIDLNEKTVRGKTNGNTNPQDLFLVKGNLTVNNGTITAEHIGANMGWGGQGTIFNITAGGVVTLNGVTAKHLGGTDMNFVAHLNNWGTASFNVENSILEATYIAVRVFNSGPDMNNVSIKNTTLKGKYCFWVHNYNAAGDNCGYGGGTDATLNFDIFNGTNTFEYTSKAPVLYGFNNPIYFDADGEAYGNAAKIGDVEYETLDAAVAAAKAGETITLIKNVTIKKAIAIENVEVIFDLNGKTVKAPASSAFEAKTGAEVTIKNGKVVAYESTVRAIGGKAIIESGEYTSTGTAVDTPATYRYSLDCREGGELVVNGGTFKSNNGMINVSSAVTINGGKFENVVEKSMTRHFAYVSAPLTINDGEFYGKANSAAGGCFFCGAAEGCDIQVNGGKFTSLWISGSVNRIFESYYGGTINVTGGMFNTNGGIATFVTENTDEATKAAYPYVAK